MRRTLPKVLLAAVLTAGAVAIGCAVNPATGERELSLVSESQEIAMGREYDPQITASMGLYPDSQVQRYVRGIGLRMAAQSERPDLPWTFRVLDDPLINAFAVPGGFIYITRGILSYMDNEAQLATVLGHEIGHVTARHTAQQLTRTQLAQAGLVLGSVFSETVAGVAGAASQGLQVLFLKFGRDDERQSDDLAFRYMGRTNYDVREAAGVFEMLLRVSSAQGSGSDIPEWLSTHPDPGDRAETARQRAASLPAAQVGDIVRRDGFLAAIDDIVFGNDPRQGYFRGTRFIHPELTFRIDFPDGWRTANQTQAVLAGSPRQDALMQLTLAQQATPETAARAFLSQQGLTAGTARNITVNGLQAVAAEFSAQTQQGTLRGVGTWIRHGESVYQLLGYSTQQAWSGHAQAVERSIASFARETDRALLDVQPMRVDVVRIDRAMTLAEFAERHPGPATLDELVLLNQATDRNQRFAAGTQLKRLTGRRPPE